MFDNSPNLIRFQLKSPILTNNLTKTFRRPTNLYLNGAIGTHPRSIPGYDWATNLWGTT